MEEKAKNRINLNAATEDGFRKEVDKLSYEQLKELAIQSTNQARKMYQDLQMAQGHEFIARINFLFKVLEFAKYFESNYVRGCSKEISRVLELPEEQGDKEEKIDNMNDLSMGLEPQLDAKKEKIIPIDHSIDRERKS